MYRRLLASLNADQKVAERLEMINYSLRCANSYLEFEVFASTGEGLLAPQAAPTLLHAAPSPPCFLTPILLLPNFVCTEFPRCRTYFTRINPASPLRFLKGRKNALHHTSSFNRLAWINSFLFYLGGGDEATCQGSEVVMSGSDWADFVESGPSQPMKHVLRIVPTYVYPYTVMPDFVFSFQTL